LDGGGSSQSIIQNIQKWRKVTITADTT